MVRRRFDGLVAAMRRHRDQAGALASAIDHFAKVTRKREFRRLELVLEQIATSEAERDAAVSEPSADDVDAEKVTLLSKLGGIGADSDDAAHPIRDHGAHHSEMMPPTWRAFVGDRY